MATSVIVDGNNLAHYLFMLGSRRTIPLELDEQLIADLDEWARIQEGLHQHAVRVEYCLDPRPEPPASQERVTVFVVGPGKQADALIVDRIAYHAFRNDPCLVISSDEELARQAAEYGARRLKAHEFAPGGILRYADANQPLFIPLPRKIPRAELPHLSTPAGIASAVPEPARSADRRHRAAPSAEEYDRLVAQTLAARNPAPPPEEPATQEKTRPPEPQLEPQPEPERAAWRVQLDLATWPLEPGAKFLKESFCPTHLKEVQALFELAGGLRPGDLPALAELLREHCAAEADFICRGGSLMDRVRLALLGSESQALTAAELAGLTGDRISDMKHKLRQADGRWVRLS